MSRDAFIRLRQLRWHQNIST